MADVLLSNDDITVLGPPETVEVTVDIGPQGQRGSKYFVGSGDPNGLMSNGKLLAQTIYLGDMYINVSPGADYSYMYQYQSQPAGNVWVKTLQIKPAIFSKNFDVTYTAGAGQVIIPISSIATVSGTPLTAANFNIQYSFSHTNAVSSSMTVPELVSPGTNLVINFKALEYAGSAWQNLSGEVTMHLFISIV